MRVDIQPCGPPPPSPHEEAFQCSSSIDPECLACNGPALISVWMPRANIRWWFSQWETKCAETGGGRLRVGDWQLSIVLAVSPHSFRHTYTCAYTLAHTDTHKHTHNLSHFFLSHIQCTLTLHSLPFIYFCVKGVCITNKYYINRKVFLCIFVSSRKNMIL